MTSTPVKIVVVDDNPDYRFTMETFLKKNGFQAATAADGKKGLALIRSEQPDLILLDVMMETTFSGFELCKAVRRDPDLNEIPIIAISGMVDELGVGFDQVSDIEYFSPEEFVEKPVDKATLLATIHKVLARAEIRRKRPQWQKDMEAERVRKHLGQS